MFNAYGTPACGDGRITDGMKARPVMVRAFRGLAGAALVLCACLLGACGDGDPFTDEERQEDGTGRGREEKLPEVIRGPSPRVFPARNCSLVVDPLSDMYDHTRPVRPFCYYTRGRAVRARGRSGHDREISLEAFRYGFSPSHIVFRKGEKVLIDAVSRDVVHGVCIREYGIDVPVRKGEVKKIEFNADRAGEFIVWCSVECGPGCSRMKAIIVVEE